jgi:hypothetical protein
VSVEPYLTRRYPYGPLFALIDALRFGRRRP